jgi:vacuolar-type H+-ATPase subunit E/Vma4
MATVTQSSEHVVKQAIAAWESAVESGVRMQEESARWLRETLGSSNALSEYYKKGQTATDETIAKAQETFDEALRAINQQAESSVRLVQKALDTRRSDANSDPTAQCAAWWETATESMRTNSQSLLKANSHIVSIWSELARKINDDTVDTMSQLAQKTAEQAERMTKSAVANAQSMVKQAAGD